MPHSVTVQAIAELLQGRLIGDGGLAITRVAHPADIKGPTDLALAADPKLLPLLAGSGARAAVIGNKVDLDPGQLDACIIVDRPRVALARLTNLFAAPVSLPAGVHPTAIVEEGVVLGDGVAIGAYAYICRGARIGAGSTLHPQTYIGPDAVIGAQAMISPGVRIGARVVMGARCIVHYNTSIGADGFSYVTPQRGSVEEAKQGGGASVTATNDQLLRIASLGSVVIGDDVEIGANSSIDRGTLLDTRIGNGTKIDNQVQIGHNVVIGENCMLCGRVGIAGSVTIGDRVVFGGAAGAADHVEIADDAIVMAMSGVAGNVVKGEVVGGIPALPRDRIKQNLFNIGRLRQFYKKIDGFAERIDRLEEKEKSG